MNFGIAPEGIRKFVVVKKVTYPFQVLGVKGHDQQFVSLPFVPAKRSNEGKSLVSITISFFLISKK